MFQDLRPELVEKLYGQGIRYLVLELPFFGWVDGLPALVQPGVTGALKGLASAAINAKVDFSVDLRWGEEGYDQVKMLQARAPSQPPIVVHPVTGEPHWFCNVHSHSSKLRKDREAVYGAERFEDSASQINKSDMYYGDDGAIADADLEHMDAVTMKHVQYVKMSEGAWSCWTTTSACTGGTCSTGRGSTAWRGSRVGRARKRCGFGHGRQRRKRRRRSPTLPVSRRWYSSDRKSISTLQKY